MEHQHESDGAMKSRANIALIVFLVIAAFFLIAEHRAHLFGWSPYWPHLLLLACLLMHRFMHGGHGHAGHGSSEASNESAKEKK
jgi:Protein of unknown function (DUF2933)